MKIGIPKEIQTGETRVALIPSMVSLFKREGHEMLVEAGAGTQARASDDAFKKADHPFRIAIVCAMWLTGFDVKNLANLYLDKPLKAHTLMRFRQ